jgi:Ser-tRNA(Ala) deacylase AlaX
MTTLLYLHDTYLFTAGATVVSIEETEKGTALLLNQTIFYPQGGGQPADQGVIKCGDIQFNVTDVRLSPEGIVYHYGTFNSIPFNTGENVELEINQERRLLNARVHTGGHLIDVAVNKAGITGITPTKGYHFTEGPYVEYEGVLEDAAGWMDRVAIAANEVVTEDVEIIAEDVSPEDAVTRGIWAPQGKSARFVYFKGYEDQGCGCGGTHVARSGEVGSITIRSVKSKKGKTKVAYTVGL